MKKAPEIDVTVDVLAHTSQRDEELSIELTEKKPFRKTSSEMIKAKTSSLLDEGQLQRVGVALGIELLNVSNSDLVHSARADAERLGMTTARLGAQLCALKQRLPHGQFEVALDDIGLSPRNAQHCMQIAHFLAVQPDDRLRRFAELPKSKVLELARAEPEVLDEFLSNEDGDELEALSVRDLRFSLKDLREQKERIADELTRKEIELDTAKAELRLAAGYERFEKSFNFLSPDVLEIREESFATSDLMLGAINHLRSLHDRFLGPMSIERFSQPPNPRGHLDDAGQIEARVNCAATLYHNLAGAIAPALRLMQKLEEGYTDAIGGSEIEQKYSSDELILFQEKRDNLLAAAEAARKMRSAERHNKVNAGRRGRPRKVEG